MTMQDEIIGVYKILNIVSEKYYIGYSKNIERRFKDHIYTLEHNNHGNIVLQRSFNKHGLDNFTFEVLHEYDNVEEAKAKELEYLQNLEIRPMLYNLNYNNSGGDILSNHPDKEAIIERISNTLKENYSKMTEQERKDKYGQLGEKNGMFGKTHTDEVKKKFSELLKNNTYCKDKKLTPERCAQISEFAKTRTKDKNPMYGKTLSDQVKKQISERKKGEIPNTIVGVTIDNVSYNSLSTASKALKIPTSTILWRVKSDNHKFNDYKYTDKASIIKKLSTKISINNIEYNSILEASEKLGFSSSYVNKRTKSELEEDKDWKIVENKRDLRLQVGKKVQIHGVVYNSIKEASRKLNIVESTLTKILNAKEPIPVSPKKPVSIEGVAYESVSDASEKLQTNINVIITRLKSDSSKFKNQFYLPREFIDLTQYKYL